MISKLICVLIVLSPVFTFSQTPISPPVESPSHISADSANKLIANGGPCGRITFTKIEQIPSLKIPKSAFEDSIASFLKSQNAFYNTETIRFHFVVTCHSEINGVEKVSGNSSNENEIQKAILRFSDLWLPGRQNGYIANSYVKLEMKIEKDKLTVSIFQ